MFIHRGNVPIQFALAVYRIMHNQAGFQEWELIDNYIASKGTNEVGEWIKSILIDNKTENIEAELAWWMQELGKRTN